MVVEIFKLLCQTKNLTKEIKIQKSIEVDFFLII